VLSADLLNTAASATSSRVTDGPRLAVCLILCLLTVKEDLSTAFRVITFIFYFVNDPFKNKNIQKLCILIPFWLYTDSSQITAWTAQEDS
jgi:hypothetical protein